MKPVYIPEEVAACRQAVRVWQEAGVELDDLTDTSRTVATVVALADALVVLGLAMQELSTSGRSQRGEQP